MMANHTTPILSEDVASSPRSSHEPTPDLFGMFQIEVFADSLFLQQQQKASDMRSTSTCSSYTPARKLGQAVPCNSCRGVHREERKVKRKPVWEKE